MLGKAPGTDVYRFGCTENFTCGTMERRNSRVLHFFLALASLLIGSIILSIVYEGVAGNERFSLPFANIFLVVVVGSVLYFFFGFRSTIVVLGLYTVWAVVGGLIDRRA
jgi:hypothetical protein